MRRPRTVELHSLGTAIRATDAPDAVVLWLCLTWSDRGESRLRSADTSADASPDPRGMIDIVFHAAPPRRSFVASRARGGVTRQAVTRTTRAQWRLLDDQHWVTGDARAGLALELCESGALIDAWCDRSQHRSDHIAGELVSSLQVAIWEAMRSRGLVPLHAAVAVRRGEATAFVGPSGAGKSSTLLAAVGAGWSPLCEDCAWFDPATRRVYRAPSEHGVRLTPDGLRRQPIRWLNPNALQRERDGKFLLRFDHLLAPNPTSATLTRVLSLRQDRTRPSCTESIDARQATRVFWEAAGVPLCATTRNATASHVRSLLSSLTWQRLILGQDSGDLGRVLETGSSV